jgi:hypothetical protein
VVKRQEMETTKLGKDIANQEQIIVKTYRGTQTEATARFQADAVEMAAHHYYPTSQTWTPGQYGCVEFVPCPAAVRDLHRHHRFHLHAYRQAGRHSDSHL